MTAIVWARRRAALGKLWRDFAASRMGLVGLVALLAIIVLAVLCPLWIGENDLSVIKASGGSRQPPSAAYWLGTVDAGRSVLALTVYGARVSLVVGIAAAVLSVGIGTIVGMVSGHFGRWVSAILMRVTDFFLVLPALVLAIALSTMLSRSLGTIVLAI